MKLPWPQANCSLELALNANGEVTHVNRIDLDTERTQHHYIDLLSDYLQGKRNALHQIPLQLIPEDKSPNALLLLAALRELPSTTTYQALGIQFNLHPRQVGRVLNQNPLPILLPCHRVLPKSGKLGGFAWGPETKELLLKLDNFYAPQKNIPCPPR